MKLIHFSFVLFCSGLLQAQTLVFSEDFQNGIPTGFTLLDEDGYTVDPSVSEFQPAWISLPDPLNTNDTVAGATSFFSPVGIADRWLITPLITLGSYGNSLSWEARSHDASFPDSYQVLISTTDTQVSSFDTLKIVYSELSSWNARTLNLSDSGYNDVSVYLAFRIFTNDGYKLYLDDIQVHIDDPVALNEVSGNHIQLYPNPVKEILYFTSDKTLTYTVINSYGVRVLSGSGLLVDVSSLSAGMYIIEFQDQKGQHSRQRFMRD